MSCRVRQCGDCNRPRISETASVLSYTERGWRPMRTASYTLYSRGHITLRADHGAKRRLMEPKMSLKTWTRTLVPTLLLLALPALSMAQISLNISVNVPPPELPVYEQPAIPEDGYIWTPGYWAWGDDIQDYYWVPGTWVAAPQPGYLWTPAYWGWQDGAYIFN